MKSILMIGTLLGFIFPLPSAKVKLGLPPLVYKDYSSLPAPSTEFAPGEIFRIPTKGEDKGKVIPIGELQIKGKVDTILIPEQTEDWNWHTFLNFSLGEYAHTSTSAKQTFKISTQLPIGYAETLYEQDWRPALNLKQITYKPDNKYYVVISSVKFDSIDFNITKNTDVSGEITADLQKVTSYPIKLIDSTAYYKSKVITLKRSFPTRQRIFYKVVRIEPSGNKMAGQNKYDFYEVKEPVVKDLS